MFGKKQTLIIQRLLFVPDQCLRQVLLEERILGVSSFLRACSCLASKQVWNMVPGVVSSRRSEIRLLWLDHGSGAHLSAGDVVLGTTIQLLKLSTASHLRDCCNSSRIRASGCSKIFGFSNGKPLSSFLTNKIPQRAR